MGGRILAVLKMKRQNTTTGQHFSNQSLLGMISLKPQGMSVRDSLGAPSLQDYGQHYPLEWHHQ